MKSVRTFRGPRWRPALRAILPLAACVLALAPMPARAQALRELSLVLDNDAYNFWIPFSTRPDQEYTNGIDVAAEISGAPGWRRLLGPAAPACTGAEDAAAPCLSATLRGGQKIFTPRRDGSEPQPGERPYAGWLYVSSTGHVQTASARRSLGLEVGMTGPPSLAESTHRAWHRALGFWEPRGWAKQVKFEPGVVLRYDEARLLADVAPGGVRVLTLVPEAGAAMGNVLTGAHAGVRARAGWAVPHPWSAAADRGAGRVSAYLLGGARGRVVAHSIFLGGNILRGDGPAGVRHEWLVGEAEAGAGLRYGALTLEYRVLTRGREYATEPGGHTYSTFDLRVRVR